MHTVVGLYDRFEDAQHAVQALTDAGFDSKHISLIASDTQGKYSRYLEGDPNQKQNLGDGAAKGAGIGAVLGGLGGILIGLGALAIPGIGPVIAAGPIAAGLAGAGVGAVAGGVVGALVDLGVPEEHAKKYEEGIRRGGTLVTVQTDQGQAAQAQQIMNRFHPVNINDRAAQWQQGGQQQQDRQQPSQTRMDRMGMQQAIPVTGSQEEMDDQFTEDEELDVDPNRLNPNIPVTGTVENDDIYDDDMNADPNIPVTGGDVTLPVVEEDLLVGKRQVEQGGVRVEKNIVEEPVDEDINLRHEHVNVERRPVDRPATEQDFNAFQEGSMELHETTEEPVVEKRARVVEEVHLNKDVEEENRKIHDTVRRTDVNIQQVGGQGGDWSRYDATFRNHFNTMYSGQNSRYEDYQPAYRMGYSLANDPQYQGYDWTRMEPIARRQWEEQGLRGKWQDVKDSVRFAWESAMNR